MPTPTIKFAILESSGTEFNTPTEYLPNAQDIAFSQSGWSATDMKEAVIESKAASRSSVLCAHDGNSSATRWLAFFPNNTSNSNPLVLAKSCTISELSVSVSASATSTFTLYKNGSSVATISLSAQKKNNNTFSPVSCVAGDTLSVAHTSGSCTKPQVSIWMNSI